MRLEKEMRPLSDDDKLKLIEERRNNLLVRRSELLAHLSMVEDTLRDLGEELEPTKRTRYLKWDGIDAIEDYLRHAGGEAEEDILVRSLEADGLAAEHGGKSGGARTSIKKSVNYWVKHGRLKRSGKQIRLLKHTPKSAS